MLTAPKQAPILLFQLTTGTPSASDVTSFILQNPPQIWRVAQLRLSPLPLRVRVGFSLLAKNADSCGETCRDQFRFWLPQSTQSHLPAVSKRTTQLDDPCSTNGAQPCSVWFSLQIWSEHSQRQEKGEGDGGRGRLGVQAYMHTLEQMQG